MSTVQPPPPPPTLPAATPATSLPVLTVSNPPPALTALAVGTPVSALVISALAQGTAGIETPLGTFTVETRFPLKNQQSILLHVGQNPGKGALVLNLVEIAGKPVTPGIQTTQSGPGLPGSPTSTVATGPATTLSVPTANVSLLVGSTVNATTLTSISTPLTTPVWVNQAGAGATTGAQSPTTTILGGPQQPAVSIPGVTPTKGGQTPHGTPPPSSLGQGAVSLTAGDAGTLKGTGGTGGNEVRIFPIGSRFSITIQSIAPAAVAGGGASVTTNPAPVSGANPAAPFAAGTVIGGQVSAHTLSGQPVVQIPHGSFAVGTSQTLPVGTDITFKIDTLPEPADPARQLSPALQRTGMIRAGTWPSLDEGLSAIQATDPSLAQQLNSVVLPKADIKLAATTLFFLNALRGGDIRGWLGDNATRLLERMRPDVMRRLGNDFRLLAETDEGGGARRATEWRGTMIPFLNGHTVEQIRLFTRQHGENDDESDQSGTRFLVDITLTNIGRFQLDGIAETEERRLDMIVRTASTLPDRVRADLMKLFVDANDTVGMRGGMVFQASPDSFVEPISDPKKENGVGIVV